MASSSRTFVIVNIILVMLIGGMFWFLSTQGQMGFITLPSNNSIPATAKQSPPTANSTSISFSKEGLSDNDIQAIEALQAQLEAEKKRAAQTRAQLQAREQETEVNNLQQNGAPAVPAQATTPDMDVEQQKQRIAQMIQAQLQGAAAENQRLALALSQKNQEIAAVKKQNSDLARKLIKLDGSAQTLLEKLVAEGKNISSSDQSYLSAMQELQNDTASPQRSVNFSETDLINRIEISDNSDTGSIAAQLRSAVDDLMEKDEKPVSGVKTVAPVASSGQGTDLQSLVSTLMAKNKEQKSQQQFQADSAYLDSLTPMEKERLNETRWVTVRRGDTLYDIADRVYNNGRLYHKLFEANPQVLSNPDLIKPGMRLRVPL